MKKSLRLKLCASFIAAAIFGIAASGNTIAASGYIKLDGGENIYVASGTKSSSSSSATYTASTKTLTLKNYAKEDIVTNIPGLKVACAPAGNVVKTTNSSSSSTLATPVTIAANICGATQPKEEKNPDTSDPIAIYAILFIAAGGILIFRRHFAKR